MVILSCRALQLHTCFLVFSRVLSSPARTEPRTFRMFSLGSALLMPALVSGILELPVSRQQPQSLHTSGAGNGEHFPLTKRTVGTNMFNILTWSAAGAYYINGESCNIGGYCCKATLTTI